MSVKKHVAETSVGLFEIINQMLREKGVSTDEFPLTVTKLQLLLQDNQHTLGLNEDGPTTERKCKTWGSELRKMTDPHTGKTIVQLVEFCEEWEDD